ncbi:delta-60 repeat domain-containing protein/Por secretion system C-terminal sorting domain-containing protein [Chryseobacterium taeanense]|uniref:Delta-60 repeat domain-containing protein/Por secretion system C-terminal sorting domain-containing protein n=1 Tax=Chryseobacterium taeanense TaxID=311334 RepID=A0A1G8E3J6_9FLAO|nr:T9SS type A sorting domain-containing protein [Chryseobacterium taeanense]SDH64464.1 delta-60 repeat domain-containing protein/Por secretion system C-terminal sorting domain-containing protein [Chryseobacterium taeanense]
MIKKITFLSILLVFYGYFQSQTPGTLDSSFGIGGKMTSNYFTSQKIYDTATQTDGKIVAVGACSTGSNNNKFYAIRFNSNGGIDTSFGSNGFFSLDMSGLGYNNYAATVELQPDGKIILGGDVAQNNIGDNYHFGILRLNVNGTVDTTFGNQGKSIFSMSSYSSVSNEVRDIALQADGKIIVAGTYYSSPSKDFAVARLNIDGSLDSDFSNDGKVLIDFTYNSTINDDEAYRIKILNDSRILIGGDTYSGSTFSDNGAWCMLQSDGSLDSTFGTGGKKTFTTDSNFYFGTCYFLPDNSILIGGQYSGNNGDAALYKVSLNGTLDTTFGNNGKVIVDLDNSSSDYDISDLDIDSTGKIYAVGRTDTGGTSYFYLINFNANGTLNTSFSYDGKVLVNFGASYNYGNSVSIQPDGKVLLAGYHNSPDTASLARFNNQSNLNTTEISEQKSFAIYPNPTTDFFVISKSEIVDKNQKVEILDEAGRIIKTVFITADNLKIQVSDLNSGIYYVRLNKDTKKLIIK